MDKRKKIGLLIKRKRQLLDMSQEELAHKVGYKARTSVNKIEKGNCDIPPQKIKLFANALNCEVEELISNDLLSLIPNTNKTNDNTNIDNDNNNDDVERINIDMSYQKQVQCMKVKDSELGELLLQIWFKYNKEYKKSVDEIDDLVIRFYEVKNDIKQKNNTLKLIFNWFDNVDNQIWLNNLDNDSKKSLINDLSEIIKTAGENGDIETLLHALNNRF